MPKKKSETYFLDEDGNFTRPDDFRDWLRTMQALFADGKVKVSIERPKRSLRQNALYWGHVLPQVHQGLKDAGVHDFHLMDEDGELMTLPITVNFLHLLLKRRHLTPDDPGKEPSTRTLSTTEFSEYIRAIRHDPLVEKHDIHVRMPDEPPIQAYD